ncbi:S26 family signal peptidase [Jeotgalibacillus sp. R-1-5s-1]|uniref:S26 family signal peptidase n=1 Tax=Jeotgalibacillus sp. R-1-5s-1 TaxID=2555897 RepID=UPI00141B2B60|nr:S26 family signal peptidase [Jeotgalibacillus sp. R-1-5s-1]
MNRLKREIDHHIGKRPRFTNELKQQILIDMKKSEPSPVFFKRNLATFKYAAILSVLLVFTATFLYTVVTENSQELTSSSEETSVIKDDDTSPEIETYSTYEEPLELLDYGSDSMDRGNHDYTVYPLIIDPSAIGVDDISRGDVVAYEYDFFDGKQLTVSRVIGLPGETVEIKEGQIYINDQKLDTFYGKVHRLGFGSNEEYNEALKENGAEQNLDSMKDTYALSIDKFQLGENELYLAGDDWFRGVQHTQEVSELYGKVLGYYK